MNSPSPQTYGSPIYRSVSAPERVAPLVSKGVAGTQEGSITFTSSGVFFAASAM